MDIINREKDFNFQIGEVATEENQPYEINTCLIARALQFENMSNSFNKHFPGYAILCGPFMFLFQFLVNALRSPREKFAYLQFGFLQFQLTFYLRVCVSYYRQKHVLEQQSACFLYQEFLPPSFERTSKMKNTKNM